MVCFTNLTLTASHINNPSLLLKAVYLLQPDIKKCSAFCLYDRIQGLTVSPCPSSCSDESTVIQSAVQMPELLKIRAVLLPWKSQCQCRLNQMKL